MKRIRCMAFMLLVALAVMVPAMGEETEPVQSDWMNILLLGGDSRTTYDYERSDSIIILSANLETAQMKMCSILRDTWVTFPEINKSHRINAATAYSGPELAVETVNQYYDMDIEKYVLINMDDMVHIVDILGGIDIWISEQERGQIGARSSGYVHLDGKQTLAYTRIRKIDNDFQRVERQKKVLIKMAEVLQNMDVDELMGIVDDLMEHVQTNLSDEELKTLAEVGMLTEVDEIQELTLPVDGSYESGFYNGTFKIYADFEKNAEALHEFIYGTEDDTVSVDK